MNVAMVVYSHYSRDARVKRYAQSLERKGYNIDIVCLQENHHIEKKGINLFMFPFPRKRLGRLWYLVEYTLFFLYSFVLVSILYPFRRYSVIHIHNMPDLLVFTSIIPKIFGARIILDMHDPMPELYMSKYLVNKDSYILKLIILIEKLSIIFCDHVITANNEFEKIFISRHKINKNKISVILNCPDSKIFFPNKLKKQSKNNFILFYMGTVEERFGLDIAVEGIVKIKDKIPNILLIIIPKLEEEGKYLKKLKSKINALSLTEYIIVKEPVPLEKIAAYLYKVDIGIVLAKNGVFTDNIFPVKLLEFVQMEIPVIATRTKILSNNFDSKSIYFLEQNTSEEFTKTVLDLWDNKKLRVSFAQSAKKYLKKNNWEKEEKKYQQLLQKLI